MSFQYKGYEAVIGLEVHVQLDTKSKIFSHDKNQYGTTANHHIHPISLAHPGTLPVVNADAVQKAITLALAIGAKINKESRFDRKHYNYPDLPKGYQITQNFLPICENGEISLQIDDTEKTVRFHHVHMEEDAGKSIHADGPYSLIDLNRAGTPLLEIVTEPDMRSGQEVFIFIQELQRLVRFLRISNADMEKGSLRCDCNVSVRKIGDQELGERCEIKNLNSKKFAKDAVEIEAKKQIETIIAGGVINKSTLHYDPKTKKTTGTREKESDKDYRYVPDPDLPPVMLTEQEITNVKNQLPTLPKEQEKIYVETYGLTPYQASLLCSDIDIVHYYNHLVKDCNEYKELANITINKILPKAKEMQCSLSEIPIHNAQIHNLILAIKENTISNHVGMNIIFDKLISDSDATVQSIIKEEGLNEESAENDLDDLIKEILSSNMEEVLRYRNGKKALFGFFMGKVMKKTQGKADPKTLKSSLTKWLNEV